MSNVNSKSTKAELLDEITRLNSELKEKRIASQTVGEVQEQKAINAKKDSAKAVIDMGILNDTVIKQFNDVIFSIKEAEKELADIQGVKEAIIDAEAVIMAKDLIIAKKIAEEEARLVEIETHAKEIVAKRELDIEQKKAYYDELSADLKKAREREIEEYKYKLQRERQIENDQWEDIKNDRERSLMQRESDVFMRERAVADSEELVKNLTEKVSEIPALIQQAKEDGFIDAKKAADREKAIEINSIKKNAEWEIKMANMEKDRAAEDLVKAQDKIAKLEEKLEAAYASMNTLATTTVQSTGGVKILETGKDK